MLDNKLAELIVKLEAKEIFDAENYTEEDKQIAFYLTKLSKLDAITFPSIKEKNTLSIFGYRPNNGLPKQYGNNLNSKEYAKMKNALKKFFVDNKITDVYTGVSLGTEMASAFAVLELRNTGYPIKLHLVQVFNGYNETISGKESPTFAELKRMANSFLVLTNEGYKKEAFGEFTNHIIDKTDNVLVVCNTENIAKNDFSITQAIKVATDKKKKVHYMDYIKLK